MSLSALLMLIKFLSNTPKNYDNLKNVIPFSEFCPTNFAYLFSIDDNTPLIFTKSVH